MLLQIKLHQPILHQINAAAATMNTLTSDYNGQNWDDAVITMNQITTMYYGRNWDAAAATMNQLTTMYYGRNWTQR